MMFVFYDDLQDAFICEEANNVEEAWGKIADKNGSLYAFENIAYIGEEFTD